MQPVLYLDQASRRQLLCVNDQLGAIPESQGVAEEDDAPQVALKHTNNRPLFDAPVLSLNKVSVIPVKTQTA